MQEEIGNKMKRILSFSQNQRNVPHKMLKSQSSSRTKSIVIIDTKIYLFVDSVNFQRMSVLLTDFCDSITKPSHVHEYQMTVQSLLRAKSLNYESQKILSTLKDNMRNKELPNQIIQLIRKGFESILCPRLYLEQEKIRNIYFLQIDFEQFYDIAEQQRKNLKQCLNGQQSIIQVEGQGKKIKVIKFEVKQFQHNKVAEILFNLSIPISSEKLIHKNKFVSQKNKIIDIIRGEGAIHCKDLKINLKAFTKLRDYQSQALKAVVEKKDEVRVKSGYIILPCGAGKTLLGIAICARIKKETLIVCSSDSGTQQWKRQIQKWTQGVHRDQIVILTAKTIDEYKWNIQQTKSYIYISTYTNLRSKFGKKSNEDQQTKYQHVWMKKMPWGLIIFDEVQWLPATENSQIMNWLMAHVKIGLTATPLRQDKEIKKLIYMIGPQLYVGSWKSFVEHGYLANPKCIEVRTKMTEKFGQLYKEYASFKKKREVEICYQYNPNKIKALIYLLLHHEALNDQIIVFCDKVDLVVELAKKFKKPLLAGEAENQERNFVFDKFREGVFKTIFLTRIGDEAIDLPNANVAIELNIQHGSRRQSLQRLGRIMRPKQASSSESYNAIFYTIVSDGTLEMQYFSKRRNCLVDLGFQYDLRVFQFNMKGDLPELMKDDPEGREETNKIFKQFIPDQTKYWQRFQGDQK